jgi:hypothetical protein
MNLEYKGLLGSLMKSIKLGKGLSVSTESVQWCWEGPHNRGSTRVQCSVNGRSLVKVRREINIDKEMYALVTTEEYKEMKRLAISAL